MTHQQHAMTGGTEIFDLVTLGSGSAARAAANEARRLGKSVAMIEHGVAGGTCLNVGCVPSKFLLAAAAVQSSANAHAFAGLGTAAGPVNMQLLIDDKDEFIAYLRERDHVAGPADAGIRVFRGSAAFVSQASQDIVELAVVAEGRNPARIAARHVLIATGASPFIPAIPGLSDIDYLTSSTAMALDHVPQSLLVIGGNAIGLEQAQLFSRLGAKVVVVELAPRIAPFEEPAISEALRVALSDEGIEFYCQANLTELRRNENGVMASIAYADGIHHVQVDEVLVATGRRPATAGLGLDAVGVSTGPRGEVVVDKYMRTSHPRIWAAGDVTGVAQFVYVASAQGTAAAANALDVAEPRSLDYSTVPRVTFTSPEVASVGLTTAQARTQGILCEVRESPMAHVVRAIVSRKTDGLIRLVSEAKTDRLLGAHMVGESAGEVIAAATYAISAGITVQQLAQMWSPSFTMSEALRNVAKSAPIQHE